MSWLGVITDAGKTVYSQYSLTGETLAISGVRMGSGTVSGEAAMRQRTDLVSQQDEGVVESMRNTQDGPQFRLRANAAPAGVGSYTMKEMGLFVNVSQGGTTTEVLLAYFMNTDGVGIPSESTFPDFVYILTATLILDNTTELSFTIPSSSYVSYLQFTEEQTRVNTAMGGLKSKQSPVSDPAASGTALQFISGITQNEEGVMIPLKKTVQTMTGATSSAAGAAGLAPAPAAGANTKFLRGDGTWAIPVNTTYSAGTGLALDGTVFSLADSGASAGNYGPSADVTGNNDVTMSVPYITVDAKGRVTAITNKTVTFKNTTYSDFTGATASAAGVRGLVPAPAKGDQAKFLRADKTWAVPTNTTYSNMTGATASAAGASGLVPAPAAGKQASFLRGDGTWAVPTNTTYSAGTGLTLTGTTFSVSKANVSTMINLLDTATADLGANDYIVTQYAGGGTTTTTYHRRPAKAVVNGTLVKTALGTNATHGGAFLRKDGTWVVPPNTTYSVFVKSGSGAAAGLVPKPPTTEGTTKYLREDGTWVVPPNTTYSAMTGATASAAGKAGLVPAPAAGKQASYLRGDGTWAVPTNTTYSNMTGATASAAGKAGLVPAPAAGKQSSYLRGDGTWAVPTNTTYSEATSSAYGLIKVGYAQNGKNYPVQLTSGKAYVYVPWELPTIIKRAYSYQYTCNAKSYCLISANNLGFAEISGYTPIALYLYNPGSTDANLYNYNLGARGSAYMFTLYNMANATLTATLSVEIIFVKTS